MCGFLRTEQKNSFGSIWRWRNTSYREKLEKYKKDQLPEEEKKKVEDEVEKAEAINEYLADKLEEELMEDDEAFQDRNEENTFHEEKDSRMEEKEGT